jgi:hypothetical protein
LAARRCVCKASASHKKGKALGLQGKREPFDCKALGLQGEREPFDRKALRLQGEREP